MAAYLVDHPPVRDQFYPTRNRPLTGCTVLHTAESVMDTIGPDTGAEAVAEFIRTRTTAGSYHDLADSDSYVHVVPYESGAYHDGTGSNNWALSLSFACGTHHWRAMTPEKRAAFLRNGARAFAAQQAWRKAHGYPLTELRYITKAQSDAGMSGFIEHGRRDPGRRTDPGINPPNLFPYDEWLDHCLAAMTGTALEDDMPDAREVADALLDTPIERKGPGAEGVTTPRAIFEWLDANLAGIPGAVLNTNVSRAGGREGTTNLAATIAWLDSNLDKLAEVNDPAAVAAAIPAGMAQQVVDLLVQRLAT